MKLMLSALLLVGSVLVLSAAYAWQPAQVTAQPGPPQTFTITPSAGDHGWIDPATEQSVIAGASALFRIGADPGYHIVDVLVDDLSVGVRTAYGFTNVQADHTISVTFAVNAEGPFTITPLPSAHGWIGPPVPQSVTAGGSALFTIGADPGYHVVDVLVDGVSVGIRSSYEFTNVQADHTISATFAVDTGGPFTITPLPADHGRISPPVPQSVAAGGSVSFTISADPGYHIADVLVDGASVGIRSTYEFTNVQANHTIGATFEVDTQRKYTITPAARRPRLDRSTGAADRHCRRQRPLHHRRRPRLPRRRCARRRRQRRHPQFV